MRSIRSPPDEDVARLVRYLQRHARRWVDNEEDIEDLVQETLVVALEQPAGKVEQLGPWTRRVLQHLALHRHRENARREAREARVPAPEPSPPAADEVNQRSVWERLREFVEDLEDPYRSVLLMRFFEELEPAEIARRLGRPEATVRSQLHRGIDRLRARINGSVRDWLPALVPLRWRTRKNPLLAAGAPAVLAGVGLVCLAVALLWPLSSDRSDAIARMSPATVAESPAPIAPVAVRSERTPLPPPTVVAEPLTGPGRLTLDVQWEDTGEPATGVALRLESGGPAAPQDLRTDASGRASAPRLAAGAWRVIPPVGPERLVRVAAGGDHHLEMPLPRGQGVRVWVITASGERISDATVSISFPGRPLEIIRTERVIDGAVLLRDVHPQSFVFAETERGQRSRMLQVLRHLTVKLVIVDKARWISGRVTDMARIAVPDATVELRSIGAEYSYGAGGVSMSAARARTDREGVFRIAWTGEHAQLLIKAPGFADTSRSVRHAQGPKFLEIRTRTKVDDAERSAIRGVVRVGDDTPLSGWEVMLTPSTRPGSVDRVAGLESARARLSLSDDEGGFSFEGCQAGTYSVKLREPGRSGTPFRCVETVELQRADRFVVLRPGQDAPAHWTATLTGGPVDEELALAVDSLFLERPLVLHRQADGRYRSARLPAGLYRVLAMVRGWPDVDLGSFELGAGCDVHTDLRYPDEGALELSLQASDGAPLVMRTVRASQGSWSTECRLRSGAARGCGEWFRFSDGLLTAPRLPAGLWRIELESVSHASASLSFEIEGGELIREQLTLVPGKVAEISFRPERPFSPDDLIEARVTAPGYESVAYARPSPGSLSAPVIMLGRFPRPFQVEASTRSGLHGSASQVRKGMMRVLLSAPGD